MIAMVSPDCISISYLDLDASLISLIEADGPQGMERNITSAVSPAKLKWYVPDAARTVSEHLPSLQFTSIEVSTVS